MSRAKGPLVHVEMDDNGGYREIAPTATFNLVAWAVKSVLPVWVIPANALSNPTAFAGIAAGYSDCGAAGHEGSWTYRDRVVTVEPKGAAPFELRFKTIARAVVAALNVDPDVWQDAMRWDRMRREHSALVEYVPSEGRSIVTDPERYAELDRQVYRLRHTVEDAYSRRAAAMLLEHTPATTTEPAEQLSLFGTTP